MKTITYLKPFAAATLVALLLAGCSGNSSSPTGPDSMGGLTMTKSGGTIDAAQRTFLRGRLAATPADPLASGNAKWENRAGRMKFSTEVEDVRTNGAHEVKVNGSRVGFVVVNLGLGDLNLDSKLGHRVPAMQSGDVVDVFNTAGTLILTGTVR
ncbi:MAG: hypothetical protein AAB393_01955 [Bacteroidota bacterium]